VSEVAGHDGRVEPQDPELSLGELFGRLTADVGRLFRQEVALARVETKQEVQRAAQGGGLLAGAGAFAYLMLIFVSLAAVFVLDEVMHIALAALIVAVVHAVVAAVLWMVGRRRLKEVRPVPEQTVETLKEDVQWAKAQRS